VVIAPLPGTQAPVLSPERARAALGGEADVYAIADESWLEDLSEALGLRLALRPGAMRIYWPGLTAESSAAEHPLVSAVAEGPEQELLEELARAFDLSRPRVRAHVATVEEVRALLEQRLAEMRERLEEVNERLRDVQIERHREAVRADQAQARLAAVAERSGGAGLERRLHELILDQWLCSLTEGERGEHPLGRYVLTPQLLSSAARLSAEELVELAWTCAMLACGASRSLARAGIAPEPAGRRMRRDDGAEGRRCKLPEGLELRYWVRADGTIEFAGLLAG
jgi:DNA-binding transcriptional ArsR family regulator